MSKKYNSLSRPWTCVCGIVLDSSYQLLLARLITASLQATTAVKVAPRSMYTLPTEVWSHIAGYLPVRDIARLTGVHSIVDLFQVDPTSVCRTKQC